MVDLISEILSVCDACMFICTYDMDYNPYLCVMFIKNKQAAKQMPCPFQIGNTIKASYFVFNQYNM